MAKRDIPGSPPESLPPSEIPPTAAEAGNELLRMLKEKNPEAFREQSRKEAGTPKPPSEKE